MGHLVGWLVGLGRMARGVASVERRGPFFSQSLALGTNGLKKLPRGSDNYFVPKRSRC